ncbi:hypothetical protein HJC23_005965 [Cyclotella cryptica]|uniref:Uncharacterized protein n=1 Tax=Cyclotella cryptica TaxID=29204 RepID=A0ABD3R587_9STRA|eukprot:CCRYP_000516-RA/>CCRYP_000516-RA protein AED:0.30 eAED:0.30 QI:444/1/1/1/1/1/2/1393/306
MKSRPSLFLSTIIVSWLAIPGTSFHGPASFTNLHKSTSIPPSNAASSSRPVVTTNYDCTNDNNVNIYRSRRELIRKIPLLLPLSMAILIHPTQVNAASSDLFKPNPLTNPVLEKIRIWNQDEVDNLQYNGELATASNGPTPFDSYVQLLQPILAVERDILTLDQLLLVLLREDPNDSVTTTTLQKMDNILSQPNLDKRNFKKAFNAFADNIYYSDPDRANLYLGGGATPGATQSLAYLLRNEVLTNIEDMRAEVQYWRREVERGDDVGVEWNDLYGFVKMAKEGMGRYLDLVPPRELEAARAKFGG